MESGFHEMTADDYHADPCPEPSLSSSVARILLDRSPLHAWHAHPRLNPAYEESRSNRADLGSLCHKLLLGAGREIAVCPESDWRKKAAQEFKAEALASGTIPVTTPQYEQAQIIVAAAREQLGDPGDDLQAERVCVARDPDTGVWLRCMVDWIAKDANRVFDYKTTSNAHPSACAGIAAKLGYDLQQAFYQRVIAAAHPALAGRIEFRFIFQEIDPPYALSVVEIAGADVEVAERRVDAAITLWDRCLREKKWPGYTPGTVRVTLPEWHLRDWLAREMEGEFDGAA